MPMGSDRRLASHWHHNPIAARKSVDAVVQYPNPLAVRFCAVRLPFRLSTARTVFPSGARRPARNAYSDISYPPGNFCRTARRRPGKCLPDPMKSIAMTGFDSDFLLLWRAATISNSRISCRFSTPSMSQDRVSVSLTMFKLVPKDGDIAAGLAVVTIHFRTRRLLLLARSRAGHRNGAEFFPIGQKNSCGRACRDAYPQPRNSEKLPVLLVFQRLQRFCDETLDSHRCPLI